SGRPSAGRTARPPAGPAAGRRLAVAAALLAGLARVRPPLARWLDDAPASVVARELPLADRILTLWPVSCAGHLRAADARAAVCASTGVYRGAAAIEAADEYAAAVWAGNGGGGARMAQGKFLLERAVRLRRPDDLAQARAAFAAEAAAAPRRPQPWIGLARIALA